MCLSDTQDRTHTLRFLCSPASVESERRRYRRRRVNSSPSVGLLRVPTPAFIYTHPSLPSPPPPISALHLSHPTQVRLTGGGPLMRFLRGQSLWLFKSPVQWRGEIFTARQARSSFSGILYCRGHSDCNLYGSRLSWQTAQQAR